MFGNKNIHCSVSDMLHTYLNFVLDCLSMLHNLNIKNPNPKGIMLFVNYYKPFCKLNGIVIECDINYNGTNTNVAWSSFV